MQAQCRSFSLRTEQPVHCVGLDMCCAEKLLASQFGMCKIHPNQGLMMQIFGKSRLERFAQEHEDSRVPLGAWQLEAEEAQWSCPEEVQARYANAIVQPDRVIFDIKSLYKIHVKAKFNQGVLLIDKVWAIATPKPAGRVSRNVAIRSKA